MSAEKLLDSSKWCVGEINENKEVMINDLNNLLKQEHHVSSNSEFKQKVISKCIEEFLMDDFLASLNHSDRARLNSLNLPHASAWLQVIPNKNLGFFMTNPEFRASVLLRLGLPVYATPSTCALCNKVLDVHGYHSLSCGKGGDRVIRHNAIRDLLFNLCSQACLQPKKEVSNLVSGTSERPGDVFIPRWNLGKSAAIDVSITFPMQPKFIIKTAEKGGVAAKAAELAKNSKYQTSLQNRTDIVFIPFILESFGGYGSSALEFVKSLISDIKSRSLDSGSNIAHRIWQKFSFLLQKENSRSICRRDNILDLCDVGEKC